MKKVKMQVVFPQELLKEVDQVTSRRKRSEFIVEATRRALKRLRLAQAVERAAGAWRDEEYPEFSTLKDVHRWLSYLHGEERRRIERIHG